MSDNDKITETTPADPTWTKWEWVQGFGWVERSVA